MLEAGNTLLKINDLRISFPIGKEKIQVVRGIDLEIKKGEIVGILGESGSGKTVSSTSILGLLKGEEGIIDSGEILFNGQDLLKLSEKDLCKIRGKEIAYIFQDPVGSLNPYKKVGKQLEEAVNTHGLRFSKTNLLEIMADTGVDNPELIYNMYPFQLSGGQCQRVVIAMALSCQPRLVIADEPTSAIDASLRKKVLTLLKSINEKYGTSIIIITHDFDVARFLCHKVTIMYGGLVMEVGGIHEVLKDPRHPYTMELLRCVNSLNNREESLYSLEGRPPNPYEFREECPFYARCKKKSEKCQEGIPKMSESEQGRKIRCVHI